MRVRITKMPLDKAAYGKQVDGSLSLQPGAFGGADYTASDKTFYKGVKDSISAVPRDEANLEAEGGETAFGPISGQSIPDHVKIKGKRHHEGGVPLNLPDDTFIFSDTASLKINDPAVLAMFNKTPKKGGYTPAELAKPYNINKYKSILLDPDTGKLERNTATIMIKNYVMKLGALALVQESMKGFPQGIPTMAKPYMEANGISEEDLMPELKEQADALAQSMDQGAAPQMPQPQNPMAAQEMQQMAPQQAMQDQQMMMDQGQGQPGYPQQMPSGAPVAMPQQDMGQMAPEGMMAYGGTPYAQYGMEMGGYDFPYYPEQMAYGGVPRFDPGGPTGNGIVVSTSSSSNPITDKSRLQSEYEKSGKNTSSRVEGRSYIPIGGGISGWGEESAQSRQAQFQPSSSQWTGSESSYIDAICRRLKSGDLKGVSAQYAIDVLRVIDPKHKKRAEWEAQLANCQDVEKTITTQFIEEEEPEKEPCLCLNKDGSVYKDANGNTKVAPKDENGVCQPNDPSCADTPEELICKCTDPVTGEVKEFPIENIDECVCDGKRGQVIKGSMAQRPHITKMGQMDILRNATMRVNPAPSNVLLTGSGQNQGAYEEYQTKVDTAQSAVNALQNAVMTGMAGSTGAKQAQMKDLLGKSLRASMDAVAGVQSRNVDRQRETNAQNTAIDNANMLANTQLLNQGLAMQKADADTRTGNINKRAYNTAGAGIKALMDMSNIQKANTMYPQYNAEYDYGMIYPTGVEKPLTGAGGQSFDDRVQFYLAKTGDYQKAFDMAYKEARLSKQQGGETYKKGGYILASNMYPFIL